MKQITLALVMLFFTLPSVSFAAALTPQQSSSLIAVVQSAPGVPASAFVNLITSFSNITVTQATSLITVVQAAPSVPATAFVDLLTSFTVDTPTTQLATPAVTSSVIPQPSQTTTQNTTPAITPVVPVTVTPPTPIDKSEIKVTVSAVLGDQVYTDSSGFGGTSFHRRQWKVSVLDKDGKAVFGASITADKPTWSLPQNEGLTTTQTANSQSTNNSADWNTIFTLAEEVTSVTFTSGSLTKTVSI